jgi:hypothetical protein
VLKTTEDQLSQHKFALKVTRIERARDNRKPRSPGYERELVDIKNVLGLSGH